MTNLKGPIAWMASNPVAANLMMAVLIVGGVIFSFQVRQEVFPEFELDLIAISVPYPGASPAEVEQGILLAIEEQVRGLDGIKKITAIASEGIASLSVELTTEANPNKALQDIKNAVDRITSFPRDIERPIVQLITNRREVISLILHGELDEYILRGLGEKIRDEILQEDEVTTVSLLGVRPPEIAIEVPQANLRAHNLTLDDVARVIRGSALELPAGGVKTEGGEILLRTAERRDFGQEFQDIAIVTRADGTRVKLSELAQVTDGFRDTDEAAYFNGEPAVRIAIFRVGDQKPILIAEKIKAYAKDLRARLPEGVGVATWVDSSEIYADRVELLVRNALLGLALVLIILGLFLEIRLAFWVTMGIPISVLGSFLLFPTLDVSINMISLFAFIVTLGIVVDDAIVVGENIYEMRQKGMDYLSAAIHGAREVAVPVTFSILTNIAAFSPMLFVPGLSGKFFRVIPIIVISVFLISLLESLFILPAHLAHQRARSTRRSRLRRAQERFGRALQSFINRFYRPMVASAIHFRYLTVMVGIAILLSTVGMIAGGKVRFSYLPKLDADEVKASAVLYFGSPVQDTKEIVGKMTQTALEVMDENGGQAMSRGVYATVGSLPPSGGPRGGDAGASGGHLAGVSVFLVPADDRPITATRFAEKWRTKLADLTGLESLTFDYSTGPSGGAPINIELAHTDIEVLERASRDLAEGLADYTGVKDINDGFSQGKMQFDFKLKPAARALGLTTNDLGRQLRDAFYGNRAFRQQRGREEIWVMVRLPESERGSIADIDQLLIRTPAGGEIPLAEAAIIDRSRSYTQIKRTDGRRVLNVTADIETTTANANEVIADVKAELIPSLLARYPNLSYATEGEQKEQKETLTALGLGFGLAMLVVFAMLAIPFRSYIQPIVVMASIPFGVVGAVIGHMIMGYELSMISLMGIVALSGVIVNDSLVLIHAANALRGEDKTPKQAIADAGARRFRPILLTSLTTFFGLAPMIFETSVQARFLIPMAISLGFGILIGTLITLVLVPALYIIIEDVRRIFRSIIDLYKTEPLQANPEKI